jgi:hypothetical protein
MSARRLSVAFRCPPIFGCFAWALLHLGFGVAAGDAVNPSLGAPAATSMSRTAPAPDSKGQTHSRPTHSLPDWAGAAQPIRPAACAAIAWMRVSPFAPQVVTHRHSAWMPMAVCTTVHGLFRRAIDRTAHPVGKGMPVKAALGVSKQLRWRREQRIERRNCDSYVETIKREAEQGIKETNAQATRNAKPTRTRGWLPDRWSGPSATWGRGGAPWTGSRVPGQRSGSRARGGVRFQLLVVRPLNFSRGG